MTGGIKAICLCLHVCSDSAGVAKWCCWTPPLPSWAVLISNIFLSHLPGRISSLPCWGLSYPLLYLIHLISQMMHCFRNQQCQRKKTIDDAGSHKARRELFPCPRPETPRLQPASFCHPLRPVSFSVDSQTQGPRLICGSNGLDGKNLCCRSERATSGEIESAPLWPGGLGISDDSSTTGCVCFLFPQINWDEYDE